MMSKRPSASTVFILAVATLPAAVAFVAPSRVACWGTSPASVLHMSTVVEQKKVKKARKIFSFDIPPMPEASPEEVSELLASYEKAVDKMKAKDKTSKALNKEELKVVHQDDHIIVVDKPAGVLCAPDKAGNPSLAAAVFEAFGCESGNVDKMVAHRLGFDTSGLVVFARTNKAIANLNTQLRTRKVTKKYEALVCGTVAEAKGEINLALTRDVQALPYVRVYTEEAQEKLIGVIQQFPEEHRQQFMKVEKPSCTEYEVIAKEELEGNAVTRLSLTSVSGRTHQLNVHCAAFGHPIVGDSTYGIGGDASPNGGLAGETLSSGAASLELQQSISDVAKGKSMGPCVHLKHLSFKHPATDEVLSFESKSPF